MFERQMAPTAHLEDQKEKRLRFRINALRQEFAAAVAELEQLRATLTAFEIRYDAHIGILLVELDRIELSIATYRRRLTVLSQPPETWKVAEEEITNEFRTDQERIDAEYREATDAGRRARTLPPPPADEIEEEIRRLYRKLARMHHPDIAATEEERLANESAMKRSNAAMEANDLAELKRLELELPNHTEEIPGATRHSRIAWMLAEIERLELAQVGIVGDIAGLKASSTYKLWDICLQDPDALDTLESDIRAKVTARSAELENLIQLYREEVGKRFAEDGEPGE